MRVAVVPAAQTTELRRQVLRPGWPVGSVMHGDEDPAALHVAALDEDGTPLAACVLFPRPYPLHPDAPGAWQLRGMATAEPARGRGVGSQLLQGAVAELRGRGARLLWCDARERAIPFYARHGFAEEGELFVNAETDIVHRRMWLTISEPSSGPTSSP